MLLLLFFFLQLNVFEKIETSRLSLTPDAPKQPSHFSLNTHRAVKCCADLLSRLPLILLSLSFEAEPDPHCSVEIASGVHTVEFVTVSEGLASVHLPSSLFKVPHAAHLTWLITLLLMELFLHHTTRTASLWTLLHLTRDTPSRLVKFFLYMPMSIKVSLNQIFLPGARPFYRTTCWPDTSDLTRSKENSRFLSNCSDLILLSQ